MQNFSVTSQMLWTLLTLPEARHSPAFTTGFGSFLSLLHRFLWTLFPPPFLISGQCELWSQMQLLWVCGLADSLQISLLSKLMLQPFKLHTSSSLNTELTASKINSRKITQSSFMLFSCFLLHAFSHPGSLSDLRSGIISELHLFHILQCKLFLKNPKSVGCSA